MDGAAAARADVGGDLAQRILVARGEHDGGAGRGGHARGDEARCRCWRR
jgi:hypothetical protein